MKKIFLKKVLSVVFICLFVFSICAVGIKSVQAEDEDPLVTLLNTTNTYNVNQNSITFDDASNTGTGKKYEAVQQHISYDLTQKTAIQLQVIRKLPCLRTDMGQMQGHGQI